MAIDAFWENGVLGANSAVRCTFPTGRSGIFGGNCTDSTILGGPLSNALIGIHNVESPCSTIVMGLCNTINAAAAPAPDGFNTIVNGGHNTVSGYFNNIHGGGHGANPALANSIADGAHNNIAA